MLTQNDFQDRYPSEYSAFDADYPRTVGNVSTRVLLLANDMTQSGSIEQLLENADCDVTCADTVDWAIAQTAMKTFDVIVVDIRPDIIGYQAVCQLRIAHVDLPVLFISARCTADAFNRAIAVGADDVAVLPLAANELKTRVELLTAGAASRRPQKMQVGRLEIDLTERNAMVDGRPLSLYSDEYAAFEMLVSRTGAPVGKDTILAYAYDEAGTSSQANAETLIHRLRRKLAKAGAGDVIQTFGRLGYALSDIDIPLGLEAAA
jgi:two-component system cell cycle response regulator CtrA